jgi:UDP-glucose 4-epimerase
MKILITGANGFVGRNLVNALSGEHEVTKLTRQTIDLTNRTVVDVFFKDKSFDVVLHCAMVGGRRYITDGPEVLYKNLAMFYNLLEHQDKFGKLINFGSGAELDRSKSIDNNNFYYKDQYPLDYYGMAKNIIARLIEDQDKCFNIRVFNVFGADEESARFIRANVQRYIDKEPIIIHQDKMMDFFYIDDLITLVKFYLNKTYIPEEINAVYNKKYLLSEIANIINNLSNYKIDISIEQEGLSKTYVGKSTRLDILSLELKGLEQGILETYLKLK